MNEFSSAVTLLFEVMAWALMERISRRQTPRGRLESCCDMVGNIGDWRRAVGQDDGGVEMRGSDQMFAQLYIDATRLLFC